jgi:PEP-CTERM motif
MTPVRRSRSASSKGLERKIAAYTVASGAFLAASVSGDARAEIVYSGPQDIVIYPGMPANTFALSFTGSETDFTFSSYGALFGSSDLTVTSPTATNEVVLDNGGYAAALSYGTPINSLSNFGGGAATTTMGGYNKIKKKDWIPYGPWAGATNMYLGVVFNDPGNTYYGWVELSFNGVATISGWAYENTPGVGIDAGAGAVPEPSTLALGLLALGSVGVAAMHRARNTAQESPAA